MSIPKHKMGLLIAALKPKGHDDSEEEKDEEKDDASSDDHYSALAASLGPDKAKAVKRYVAACLIGGKTKSEDAEEESEDE